MGYRINECFYSVQGEGDRAGTANVFLRFSGCNLTCNKDEHGFDCDTEFTSGLTYDDAEAVVQLAEEVRDREINSAYGLGGEKAVICTGGEPGLQLDDELVSALKAAGWYVAVETNGTVTLPEGVDYVACSPKTADHTLRIGRVDEIRYVRNAYQGIPKPAVSATHRFLSPAATSAGIDPAALAHCIELVKNNRGWRLSVQQHKTWQVR